MFGKEMFAGPSRDNVPGWTLIKWPCLPPPQSRHAWVRCAGSDRPSIKEPFRHLGEGGGSS